VAGLIDDPSIPLQLKSEAGFESGQLAPWVADPEKAGVIRVNPHSGRYHLKLTADGQPDGWATASLVKKAAAGETWAASIHALRRKGAIVRLKLVFFDVKGTLLREMCSTGVDQEYVPLQVVGTAPENTAEVHLVAAVEYANAQDPAVGYFDDAVLTRYP
jgi:hypothetical protein